MADEYAAGRPAHPAALYDALEPLRGRLVVEGGCGTGISTRALIDRGAIVYPFDIGPAVIRKAIELTPGLPAVVADGNHLPMREGCADLVCFGQSWHWLDPRRASTRRGAGACGPVAGGPDGGRMHGPMPSLGSTRTST